VIAAMSHKTEYTHRPDVLDASYFPVVNGENLMLFNSGYYKRTTSEISPVVNGFAGIGYKFNELNAVEFKFMYNHNTTEGATFIIGEDGQNIEHPSYKLGRALTYEEREMRNFQLEGKSVISALNGLEIAYKANYVQAHRDEPNQHFLSSQWNSETNTHGIPLANVNDPFIFWRNLQDDIFSARLDLIIPFKLGRSTGNKFKAGGYYSAKDRDFNEHQYRDTKSQFTTAFDGDPDTYFGEDNIGIINSEAKPNGSTRYFIGNYITEATSIRNSYTGTEDVSAWYAMVTYVPITPLKIVAGVRYETTDIHVQSKIVDAGIQEPDSTNTGRIDASDWLPSLNLIYALNDRMNLRASYNHTLARPNLREIAPFASFDPLIDEFFIGNPTLTKTDIKNVDLRWEWFVNPGEVFAVSAFYKTFDNPIVLQYLNASNPEFKYVNANQGDIRGLEFEVRKSLSFISGVLRNFKLGANLALIKSSTDVVAAFETQEVTSRQFQGQSDVLANVILNYIHVDKGWDVTLAVNYTGDRLSNIGEPTESTPATDIFENSVCNLDMIAAKRFGRFSLKFSAMNLLNPLITEYIPYAGEETLTGRYRKGISFGLSAEYRL
jgi:TonB-dependent receptor